MQPLEIAIELLDSNLQLGGRASSLDESSPLMGALPEFNSLSVVGIVTGIEETLGCEVYDDEISEEIFQTVGSLAKFIEHKMA